WGSLLEIVTPSYNIRREQDELPRASERGCELRDRSRLRLNRKPIEGHNHRALPLVRAGAWRLADIWPNAGIDSRFGLIAGNCPHPSFTITSGRSSGRTKFSVIGTRAMPGSVNGRVVWMSRSKLGLIVGYDVEIN